MADAASDFARLRRALCRARAATARAKGSGDDRLWAIAERTWDHALNAYGDAMLEPITGSRWVRCFPVSLSTGRAHPRVIDRSIQLDQPLVAVFAQLLGRPLVFAREGSAGPLSARSTVFVAEPEAFDDDGCVKPWAREQAAALAEHGYGVWIRPDLDQWDQPYLSLLVATAGLTADRAAGFGFVSLAEAAW